MANQSQLHTVPEASSSCETIAGNIATVSQKANFEDLPDEIMLKIFFHCSFNDLVDALQNVCMRWMRLAHDPSLWCDKVYIIESAQKRRRIRCGAMCSMDCIRCRRGVTDREVLQTARMLPQLRTLITKRPVKGNIWQNICRNCPNLTTLEIYHSQEINCSVLKYMFKCCAKIDTLIVGNDFLTEPRYVEMLSSLENLRSLEVSDAFNNLGRAVQLKLLANACKHLQEINLGHNSYPMEDLEYFINAKKDSLTSATVRWAMAWNVCILPLLKECASALTKLHLHDLYGVYEDEAAAFTALGQLHNLRELYANRIHTREPNLISLAFMPGCLTQLQILYLTHASSLQDDTMVAISQNCPALRELRLKFSKDITDDALSKIECLKHLEILEISGCRKLCGGAMAHIARLTSLHTLVLRHIYDLEKLQPSLQDILDMKELRCLDIKWCRNMKVVPFHKFPSRILNFRELHVTYVDKKEESWYEIFFASLQCQMPQLKIFSTLWHDVHVVVTE